jgi:hypothetical protein
MTYEYEVITNERGATTIKATDETGNIFWIPTDPANSDYQRYLKYLEENNG